MKKIYLIGLIVLILFFTQTLTTTVIYSQEVYEDEIIILGEVRATQYDIDGNVIEVAICVTIAPEDTSKEGNVEYFFVGIDEKGQELLKLVGKTIEALGVVDYNKDDDKLFTVKKYEVIKEEE